MSVLCSTSPDDESCCSSLLEGCPQGMKEAKLFQVNLHFCTDTVRLALMSAVNTVTADLQERATGHQALLKKESPTGCGRCQALDLRNAQTASPVQHTFLQLLQSKLDMPLPHGLLVRPATKSILDLGLEHVQLGLRCNECYRSSSAV